MSLEAENMDSYGILCFLFRRHGDHTIFWHMISSIQFSHSVILTLCDPVDCSTPSCLVHLLEVAQAHVH